MLNMPHAHYLEVKELHKKYCGAMPPLEKSQTTGNLIVNSLDKKLL